MELNMMQPNRQHELARVEAAGCRVLVVDGASNQTSYN